MTFSTLVFLAHSGLDMTHSVNLNFTISLPKKNMFWLVFEVPWGLFPVFPQLSNPLLLSHRWFVRHASLYCFWYYKKKEPFFFTVTCRKQRKVMTLHTEFLSTILYFFQKCFKTFEIFNKIISLELCHLYVCSGLDFFCLFLNIVKRIEN